MSSYYTDLNGIVSTGLDIRPSSGAVSVDHTTNARAGQSLEFGDFLQLMVATFQNQTMDSSASISDMMNQMVQMSVVQTLTNLNTLITETSNLSYAASLVGKNVIIAQQNGSETKQIEGIVTGTGTLNGNQVVFLGSDSYWLSDILAVGKLPSEDGAALQAAEEEADPFEDEAPYAAAEPGAAEQSMAASGMTAPKAEAEENPEEEQDEEAVEGIL